MNEISVFVDENDTGVSFEPMATSTTPFYDDLPPLEPYDLPTLEARSHNGPTAPTGRGFGTALGGRFDTAPTGGRFDTAPGGGFGDRHKRPPPITTRLTPKRPPRLPPRLPPKLPPKRPPPPSLYAHLSSSKPNNNGSSGGAGGPTAAQFAHQTTTSTTKLYDETQESIFDDYELVSKNSPVPQPLLGLQNSSMTTIRSSSSPKQKIQQRVPPPVPPKGPHFDEDKMAYLSSLSEQSSYLLDRDERNGSDEYMRRRTGNDIHSSIRYDDLLKIIEKGDKNTPSEDKTKREILEQKLNPKSQRKLTEIMEQTNQKVFRIVKKNRFGLAQNRILVLDCDRRVLRILNPELQCRSEFAFSELDDVATESLSKYQIRISFKERAGRTHRPYDVLFKAKVDFDDFWLKWFSLTGRTKVLSSLNAYKMDIFGVGDIVYKIVMVTILDEKKRELIISKREKLRIINPADHHCNFETDIWDMSAIEKIDRAVTRQRWFGTFSSIKENFLKMTTDMNVYNDAIMLHFKPPTDAETPPLAPLEIKFSSKYERINFCQKIWQVCQSIEFCGFEAGYPNCEPSTPSATTLQRQCTGRDMEDFAPPSVGSCDDLPQTFQDDEDFDSNSTVTDEDHHDDIISPRTVSDGNPIIPRKIPDEDFVFKDVDVVTKKRKVKSLLYLNSRKKVVVCQLMKRNGDLDEIISFNMHDILELTRHNSHWRVHIAFEAESDPYTNPNRPSTEGKQSYDLVNPEYELDLQFDNIPDLRDFIKAIDTLSPLESPKRNNLIRELKESEKTYIKCIENLLKRFREPLEREQILQPEQIQKIFSNADQIYALQQLFCDDLQKAERVSKVFEEYAHFFKMYVVYLKDSEDRNAILAQLMETRPAFKAYCDQMQEEHGLLLDHLAITIPQRPPRYRMFLEGLCNETPKRHPEYGVLDAQREKMKEVLGTLNLKQKHQYLLGQLEQIRKKIVKGPDTPDLSPAHRYLVKTDELRVRDVDVRRTHVCLMTDMFFYTTVHWETLGIFYLEASTCKTVTTEKFFGFELACDFGSTKRAVFMCKSEEQQLEWFYAIQDVMVELKKRSKTFRNPLSPVPTLDHRKEAKESMSS